MRDYLIPLERSKVLARSFSNSNYHLEKVPVSVIVATKNNEKTLEKCLESIKRNNPAEIIVVDGLSSDKTVEIARKYATKIMSDNGKGLAFARQLGAQYAKEDWVSYTDADTIIPEGCYEVMLKEIKKNQWAGIHAQILAPKITSYWEWAEDQVFKATFNKERETNYIGTIVSIYKKNLILKYKFDPFLGGACEDGDLCFRISRAGYKFGVSSAFAYHCHRSSLRAFIKQRFSYGQGGARFNWRNKTIRWLGSLMGNFYLILIEIKNRRLKMIPFLLVSGTAMFLGASTESLWLLISSFQKSIGFNRKWSIENESQN
jgi:glycosyltransferase involved in cell wall biosynthesis